jgi:predicted nucleic acid-binding protein
MPPAAEPYGSGVSLVFDTSAWNRQRDPAVAPRWQATLIAELLVICPVVALELLAGAHPPGPLGSRARLKRAL